MGLRIIINPDLHQQRIALSLDGARCTFTFFYVRRAGGWFFHLDAADGSRLLSGARLVAYVDLLAPYRTVPGVPAGILQLLGSEVVPRDPTRDEVGDTFELFYWFADPSTQSSAFAGTSSAGSVTEGGGGSFTP